MYGPWKLLLCGYSADEQQLFLSFLEKIGLGDLPVVFVCDDQKNISLKQVLNEPHGSGLGKDSNLQRAGILSGFTQEDVHLLLSEYRKAGFPKQLWATVTPISIRWEMGFLLVELVKEAKAMGRKRTR